MDTKEGKIDLNVIAEQLEDDFVFKFVKQIDREANKNFFVSPISVKMAFAMLSNGAEGNTLQQLLDSLGYSNKTIGDLNNDCHKLISHWDEQKKDNEEIQRLYSELGGSGEYQQIIETANSVWSNKMFVLSDSFMATIRQFYDAESASLDFADAQKALSIMNDWCNQKTHGMIPKMLENIDPNYAVILANTLYFKGNWKSRFESCDTHKSDFFNCDGSVTKVKMMNQETFFNYVRTDCFAMAELSYEGSTCMDIILPNNGISVSQCIGVLNQARFNAALKEMSRNKLNVHLPKFDMQFNQNLVEIMKLLGVADVFSPTDADLSNMSNSSMEGAFVSDAFQLSCISVDENGTEAAAVTAVCLTGCCHPMELKPIDFNVNHPFAYIIRDKKTNTVLFVGKVEKL